MKKRYTGVYGAWSCVFFTIFTSCLGCSDVYESLQTGERRSGDIHIASWNVQALFDSTDEGWEYREFREGSGWTEEKYHARLNSLSKSVLSINEKSPDLIAFIEIENAGVLERLRDEFLPKHGYAYPFFAGNPGYALGIGALSKLPLRKAIAHSINIDGALIPRPVAELWVELSGETLVVFICHWKSKLGGDADTEWLRREAAKVIVRRQQELAVELPGAPIVVLGDLNENHNEFYRQNAEYICALLPDDAEAAGKTGYAMLLDDEQKTFGSADNTGRITQDFLILSNAKPPKSAFFASSAGVFYSPWGNELSKGSYYYQNTWETIDHILLNDAFFDKTGIEFKSCAVIDREPFINAKGEPNRYNPQTGSGVSDHLPLLLTLSIIK